MTLIKKFKLLDRIGHHFTTRLTYEEIQEFIEELKECSKDGFEISLEEFLRDKLPKRKKLYFTKTKRSVDKMGNDEVSCKDGGETTTYVRLKK